MATQRLPRIAFLPGVGVGPEVVAQARRVLYALRGPGFYAEQGIDLRLGTRPASGPPETPPTGCCPCPTGASSACGSNPFRPPTTARVRPPRWSWAGRRR